MSIMLNSKLGNIDLNYYKLVQKTCIRVRCFKLIFDIILVNMRVHLKTN